MAETKAKTKAKSETAEKEATTQKEATTRADELGDHPYQGEPSEGWESTDLGDAAAEGEFAYAGERSEDVWDERDEEAKPGTPEHLGESPYAGSLTSDA
jgi:hypothetical protein